MDGHQFDRLTQGFSQALSRRRFGALLAALGFGARIGAEPKVKAKKKKKKKKPKKCKNGAVKCGSACVDTTSNAAHCGGCGLGCGAGQSCVEGACQGGGGCTGGRELCGTACVNLDNDEAHCGQCNRACGGDLTCIDGNCDCAAGTKCGTECVNLQTDDDSCGQCNRACDGDLTCINGDCGCAAGTQCGNDCVNIQTNTLHCGACGAPCNVGQCVGGQCVQPPECSSDFDCGAGAGDLTCRSGRCVCKTDGEGICYRYNAAAGVAGRCNPCCPGGDGACTRDHVCRGDLGTTFGGVPFPICHCPAGTVTCDFGDSFRCSQNQATDPNRCGINCTDCTERGPTSFCCFGGCMTACEPNTNCNLRTCGGCQTCTGDTACCRVGTSNLFGCALMVNGQCPGPPP